jgi:two-component system, cell cycle sensor histidine kinase and response regulator CckA
MPADRRMRRGSPETATPPRRPVPRKTGPEGHGSPIEHLRRRAALAEAVLETSSLGVVMVDEAGRIVRANARLAQMFGYHQQALEGQLLEILLPERLRAGHVRHRRGFSADPRVRPMGLGYELAARRKDGTEFPVEISLSYVKSDEGLVALAFVTDITPRRNAEQRLHAEFLVTQVFAHTDYSGDLGSRLLQALCENLDWDVGEIWRVDGDLLRHDSTWHRPELDTREFEATSHEIALSRGMALAGRVWESGEAAWIRPSDRLAGDRATAAAKLGLKSACAFPIRGEAQTIGVVVLLSRTSRELDDTLLAMLTDIGRRIGQHLDHRRVELEFRKQRELLFQTEKLSALGRLVAGVAHEMNNPLGIISSRIELMLADAEGQALPPQFLDDLRVVHRNVMRVAGVAQALRSFARQSTGERRPVDLNTVVAETLLLVGKSMSTDNVGITTQLDPALPQLLGDANALQQVLLNLLTNAREAISGAGEIRVRTDRDPGRSGRIRLIVADTGPGIPPAHLPHLFEPFYTTKPSGTGLGLAVSYGIVQNHLGTIDVQSVPGQGATFTLNFPALESVPGSA